jgi:hypothetical protein
MTRPAWVTAIAALTGLLLIYLFAGYIWFAIAWVASGIFGILGFLWRTIEIAAIWLWMLLAAALQASMYFLTIIVAFVMVAAAFVLGVGLLIVLALMLVGFIGARLKQVGEQVRELRHEFRATSDRAGRDGAFLALITLFSGLVAYMGTEEFLKHLSTVRFLAVSCIGLVAAKLFLFFPSLIPKLSGILLTVVILIGSITFIAIRYRLAADFGPGFAQLRDVVIDPENELKLLLAVMIAVFSLLTLLFPFTLTEWRLLLATPRSRLPDLGPAQLTNAAEPMREVPARIEHRQT